MEVEKAAKRLEKKHKKLEQTTQEELDIALSKRAVFKLPSGQEVEKEAAQPPDLQVWSLTQFYSVDFSKSRIGVKKCVFNKRTIKVCDSGC